jgi:hypothetical protein
MDPKVLVAGVTGRFSYVAYGADGYVNRTVEKEVISSDAICGAYYFSNKEILEKATKKIF